MINDNIRLVRQRIEDACARSGRNAHDITVVVVTKHVSVERIQEAYDAGVRDFGENRVQELCRKRTLLPRDIRWHLIGHLQTNKIKYIIETIDLIHSVDSMHLACDIERHAARCDRNVRILLQVNASGEESKHGFEPSAVGDALKEIAALGHIIVDGFMTMAPFVDDEAVIRHTFRSLRDLRDSVDRSAQYALSMGMSSDYAVAIEEGSTIVRIGTAIFEE